MLDRATLKQGLLDLFNAIPIGQYGSVEEVANVWAAILYDYFSAITWPVDLPIRPVAMIAARASTFSLMKEATFETGFDLLKQSCEAFALAITQTTNPLAAVAVVGPPVPLEKPPPDALSADAAADALSERIDTWARTGLATPAAPGSSPLPWS